MGVIYIYLSNANQPIYRRQGISKEIGPGDVFLKFSKIIFMLANANAHKKTGTIDFTWRILIRRPNCFKIQVNSVSFA